MNETRRHPRLSGYDYSRNGAYFVTLCTRDRRCILAHVGRDDLGASLLRLTEWGVLAAQHLEAIETAYAGVRMLGYVVMPNHVHMLLQIGAGDRGAPGSSRPTVSQIVGTWKRLCNRKAGQALWQTSFYDHIIRDERDCVAHLRYMEENPAKWLEDPYYKS